MLFTLFTMLPLLEIAGFIVIGGDIGLGNTILWLIADVIAGVYLLLSIGKATLISASKDISDEQQPLRVMFDVICILIGALLLMFPGFVSDFIAIFFIVPFLRYGVFLFLSYFYGDFLEEFTKKGEGFAERYYEYKKESSSATIEGEYKVIENSSEDNLH